MEMKRKVSQAHASGNKLSNPKSAHGKDHTKRHYMNGLTAAGAVFLKKLKSGN